MTPSHPSEFIRLEVIGEPGLSVTEAVQILCVRWTTLSDLLNGKAELSPKTALRIEKAFGAGTGLLLGMQASHAAARMCQIFGRIDVQRYGPA